MRRYAGGLNRGWLIVVGLLLTLAGAAVLLIGTGALASLGVSWLPNRSDPTVPASLAGQTANLWVIVGLAVVGVLLALLVLGWLSAQVPRRDSAGTLRMSDDLDRGLTTVDSSVVCSAVEGQIERLSGVQSSSALLRGSAAQPELTVRVTADERTDLPGLLQTLQTQVADDLANALGSPLRRLAVLVDVTSPKTGLTRTGQDHITL